MGSWFDSSAAPATVMRSMLSMSVLHEPDTSLTMNYTCDEAEGSIGGRFSRLLSIYSCRSPSLMKFFS